MLPVPLSARFRAAHAWEDILFYNNPPTITTHVQLLCNLGEGYAAHTQLTKHPMPHRREIVPAFYTRLPGDQRLAILEMHVPDAFTKTFKPLKDVPTINKTRTVE